MANDRVDKPADKQSEVAQFASAAFYIGIEKPVNGLLQTVEKATTVKLPRMELVDANGADGPNATGAQKTGDFVGSLLAYGEARIAAHYGLAKLPGAFQGAASKGALAGALMGGVLTPVDEKENFWQKKGALALTDAATFGTMEGAAAGLKRVKPLTQLKEDAFLVGVTKGGVRGALSGAVAGLVNAESQAVTSGNGLASGDAVTSAAAHYALFGAALGAADGGIGTFRVKAQPESKIDDPNRIISFDKKGYLGGEDEGKVYSNGDGTVTKVFNKKDEDPMQVKAMFDELNALKIRTPQIHEIGKTEDGYPAIKMQQIGNGDHLKQQLIETPLSGRERSSLIDQYYGAAMALNKAGVRIDWQLKNMAMQNGKLYIFDPSFLIRDEPQYQPLVDSYGSLVGPRPAKYKYEKSD